MLVISNEADFEILERAFPDLALKSDHAASQPAKDAFDTPKAALMEALHGIVGLPMLVDVLPYLMGNTRGLGELLEVMWADWEGATVSA